MCHGDLEQAMREFDFAQTELETWGFVISKEKLVMPNTQNTILGYTVDTTLMRVSFDENKFEELRFLIEDAIQPSVRARDLARIIGKFVSMGYGVRVPITCFIPRAIAAVAAVTDEDDWRSWDNMVEVDGRMYEELLFLLHNIRNWNGTDLKKPYKIHFYSSENPVAETTFQPFIGDASQEAAAIYSIRNPKKFAIKFFSASMSQTSSARRELASIELLILKNQHMFQPNSTVVYASDNVSVNRWINVGTCRPDIASTLQSIFLKCLELQVDLRVTWIPRSHYLLIEADMLSRRSTDEFTLRNRDWRYVVQRYGRDFTLDVFASKFLHRTDIFYSKFPSQESSGSDGLHQPWGGHDVWMFPPRRLVGACIQRIFVERGLKGALAGFDNAEALIRTQLFRDGHAPPFIWKVVRFPVKIRMGYYESKEDAVNNRFSNTWHNIVILFIDKNQSQRTLEERCFYQKGSCSMCEGNPCVTYDKTMY